MARAIRDCRPMPMKNSFLRHKCRKRNPTLLPKMNPRSTLMHTTTLFQGTTGASWCPQPPIDRVVHIGNLLNKDWNRGYQTGITLQVRIGRWFMVATASKFEKATAAELPSTPGRTPCKLPTIVSPLSWNRPRYWATQITRSEVPAREGHSTIRKIRQLSLSRQTTTFHRLVRECARLVVT